MIGNEKICFTDNLVCRECLSFDNEVNREFLLYKNNCFRTDCPLFGYDVME
jgi:hypothetical protein